MLLRGLIGAVLRRVRLGQNRTLRDVAEVARVSVPYLSEVERGRKELSSELLAAICTALDLELSDLLSEVRFEIARDRMAQAGFGSRPTGTRTATGRPATRTTALRLDLAEPQFLDHGSIRPSPVTADGAFGNSFGSVMVAA